MSSQFRISVIICTYNRCGYLREAVESLCVQTLPASSFEVIIANNNSTDDTEHVCRQLIQTHSAANIVYLNETKQGASYARNTGASIARSPILCFMDDDAFAYKDFLEKVVRFFETQPNAGGLGGRIIPRYIPSEPAWMSYYVASMVGNFDYAPITTTFEQGKYPLESNMSVPKKYFDEIGGFNTALPGVQGTLRIGGEGKDFFFRLRAWGKKIYYDPQVIVEHVVEVEKLTPEYLYRVASGYGRGERVRTLQKNKQAYYLKVLEYLFKLGAALVLAAAYLLKGQPAKSMPLIRFRIDALKGLFDQTIPINTTTA